jgi:hypothetical protein
MFQNLTISAKFKGEKNCCRFFLIFSLKRYQSWQKRLFFAILATESCIFFMLHGELFLLSDVTISFFNSQEYDLKIYFLTSVWHFQVYQTIRKLNVPGNGITNYGEIFNRSSAKAENIFYLRHSKIFNIFFRNFCHFPDFFSFYD